MKDLFRPHPFSDLPSRHFAYSAVKSTLLRELMDKNEIILQELLDLAHRFEIRVRRERLGDEDVPVQSGLAWVDSCPVLFIDSRISTAEAVEILIRELSGFPLEDVYIKPGIRALFHPAAEDDATPG